MKPAITLISIGLVLTFVNSNVLPIKKGGSLGDVRIYVLIDNDDKLHFLDREPPQIRSVQVDETEVTFNYISRRTRSVELYVFNFEDIEETDFDPNRRTMFIVHGWNNDKDSTVNTAITNALLTAEDWNVFVVDWRDKANDLYSVALGAVPGVGDIIARFIQLLRNKYGLKLENINMSGHSLGAHICGRVGNLFDGDIENIVAMDPALPFVDNDDVDKRLDSSDAKYVQVIHTSGGLLGFLKPIGHADFYPNGGMNQNGCGIDVFGKCAHSRSHIYYAESILNNNFKARYCESNVDWKNGNCDNNEAVYMGGNNLDRFCGTFYLNTAGAPPFALG